MKSLTTARLPPPAVFPGEEDPDLVDVVPSAANAHDFARFPIRVKAKVAKLRVPQSLVAFLVLAHRSQRRMLGDRSKRCEGHGRRPSTEFENRSPRCVGHGRRWNTVFAHKSLLSVGRSWSSTTGGTPTTGAEQNRQGEVTPPPSFPQSPKSARRERRYSG